MTSITNLFGGVSIGQDTSGNIKLSFNGLVAKGPSGFVRYENGSVQEVPDELIIEGSENFIYRFPVSATKVHAGDLIITHDDPFHAVFARGDGDTSGQLNVYDPFYETISVHSPRRNVFNMVFYVKASSLIQELGIGTLGEGDFDDEILRLAPFLSSGGQSSNIWTMLAITRMLRGKSRGRLLERDNLLTTLLPLFAGQGGSAESMQTLFLVRALQEEEEEEKHEEHEAHARREEHEEHEAHARREEHEERQSGPETQGQRRTTGRQQ